MKDRARPRERGKEDDLASLAEEAQPSILREFWDFLRFNKKWWLIPILLALLIAGVLVLAGSGALAPLIYTLF